MAKSKRKWLPTVFHVKSGKKDSITVQQKSYINDLFGSEPQKLRKMENLITRMFGYAFFLFKDLAQDHGAMKLENRDLQVIVKIAYYTLKPGQIHEGVWHVEGMPDEHIVMANICYLKDDFGTAELEYRRDRSDKETGSMITVPEQNAIILDQNAQSIHKNLGILNTEEATMYAWTNSLQHKLKPLINNSKSSKTRMFLAFFLVDPDVKTISTADIPPQDKNFTPKQAYEEMEKLMKERKGIKLKLNKDMEQTLSYCEH